MAIQNFGPGRAAALIKNIAMAWPWEAMPQGHKWWMDFCSKLDTEAGVTEDKRCRPRSAARPSRRPDRKWPVRSKRAWPTGAAQASKLTMAEWIDGNLGRRIAGQASVESAP